MDVPNDRIIVQDEDNIRENFENFYDPGAPFGPIELNLLERVEHGLNLSE